MMQNRGGNGSRSNRGTSMRSDPNANVELNSVVTATVRQTNKDRGFVIVRFGEREQCSALMAVYECDLGDAAQKQKAFDELKLGAVVTGVIIRKSEEVPTSLRLSVRQFKQQELDRERQVSRVREHTDREQQLAALSALNAKDGVVVGVVASKTSYGAFVQLSEKWRALAPVGEMCGPRHQNNAFLERLNVGDKVEGVLTVKEEGGKVLLSLSLMKASESKRKALEAGARRALAEQTFASLVPGLEFVGSMYYDLGPVGVDGTDAGIILDYNGVHVWVPEKELGDHAQRRKSISKMAVRFVGFDAAHDDMPFVERVK